MALYAVRFQSPTVSYGPNYVEADSELEAKRKFARGVFTPAGMRLFTARRVSQAEVLREVPGREAA